MKATAILFDKDGTLIDFDSFWIPIAHGASCELLEKAGRGDLAPEAFLAHLGVRADKADADGILRKGTYAQIALALCRYLSQNGTVISPADAMEWTPLAFWNHAAQGKVIPTCPELVSVLRELKRRGLPLGIATTDSDAITRHCLREMGIEALFDKIYCDDGKTPPKPDPACARDFAAALGMSTEQLWMVGDTPTDMLFAQNAGITAIGMAKSRGDRDLLSPYADAIISRFDELLALLDRS